MYKMNPEYAIGIHELDEQHQHLFALIEQAQTLLKDEHILYKYDELIKILQGMKDYADRHFHAEEALMESLNYPRYKLHLEAHEDFCKKLDSFHLDMEGISLGTQDKVLMELFDYLNHWLQVHILDCDRKIARFINGEAIEA